MWTLWQTPMWFLETVLYPFQEGALTLIPAVGTVCLITGVLWCVFRPARELLWLAVPFLVSTAMLLIAWMLWEQVPRGQANATVLVFLAIQASVIGFVTYRLRKRLGPAVLLAVFNATYALFAGFVAGMAMTGSWL